MRVITANLNGIRSAARKGFFDWVKTQSADVICVQELKAQEKDMKDPALSLPGYHFYFHCAEKPGYSGVGIYTKHQPKNVVTGLGWAVADTEGRYVAVDLVGVYEGTPVLDLDYAEDSNAETDMNVVMTEGGEFIEVQGTGEKTTFSEAELASMLSLAKRGIAELVAAQKAAI